MRFAWFLMTACTLAPMLAAAQAPAQPARNGASFSAHDGAAALHGHPRAVQQTSDGGYIVVGNLEAGSTSSALVMKPDAKGAITWQNTCGLSGHQVQAYLVRQTSKRRMAAIWSPQAAMPPSPVRAASWRSRATARVLPAAAS